MENFRDPIFKGCTRPAMFLGVPLLAFLVVSGAFLLAGVWLMYLISPFVPVFLAAIYVPLFIAMREITKRVDQRLRQMILRVRMRHRHGAGRKLWGAITYSPLRYKRRKS